MKSLSRKILEELHEGRMSELSMAIDEIEDMLADGETLDKAVAIVVKGYGFPKDVVMKYAQERIKSKPYLYDKDFEDA